jgi:flagellar FliL protein
MKLYIKSLMIIGIITIIGVGGLFGWKYYQNHSKQSASRALPTIDELLKQTVDTEAITTNFVDGGFVKTQFKIVTTSQKNAEEITKLPFRVESSVINSLNAMKKEEALGPNGFKLIENNVKNELNKELGGNYVTRVYATDLLVQ